MDEAAVAPVLVRVMGPLDVVLGDRARALGSSRQRTVLAALVVHAGQPVAADALIDVLWDATPPPSAAHTLQGLVSRLRGVLGAGAIVAQPPGYLLSLGDVDIDLQSFERLAARARTSAARGAVEAALSDLDAALGLWRGRAFGEFADQPFAQPEATRLEELRAALVEDRADLLLASFPPAELVGDLEAAAGAEPYRERRQGQLMVALARSGRPVEAMRSYERFRRRLVDEVGAVPARSLQRLNDDILRQVPGTEWKYSGPDPQVPAALASGRLPRPVTSFVGRVDELAEIADVMRPGSLTTLCGPAGVGKTRAAIEVAQASRADGRPLDGVWWCDLASADPTLAGDRGDGVAIAIAAALGASPEPGQSMRDRILEFLAGKELSLVLDNCDNVVGPVAELVAAVLQHTPDVGVLVTSREPLAIDGERIVDLDPLGDDDAIRLFTDRAAAVSRGFELSPDNADTVAEICRHLDGIPLAVELAAGRLKALGVADLARLLHDRFRVLVSSRRDATNRHRTLRAAIDSSYDSLSAAEQAVFARLGVFPESFDLDAAESLCTGGSIGQRDVLELLSHLVARSLVVTQADADGAVRYRLLETLRIYAVNRLAGLGDVSAESTYRRHAEHYAAVVAEAGAGITGPDETRWLGWLVTEIPNLRAAVHRACTRGDVHLAARLFTPLHPWTWCGNTRTAEIGRWATLLAHQPDIDQHPAYPAICEWGLRGWNRTSGDERDDSVNWIERVNAPGFTPTAVTLGCVAFAMMATSPRASMEMLIRATDMARAEGDHLTEAAHLTVIVNLQLRLFSPPAPEVVDRSIRCLEAARASGSPTAIAWGLMCVAFPLTSANPDLALAAIDELPRVVARCAFPDTNLQNGAEYVRGFIQLAERDLAGLEPLRAEISVKAASGYRMMLTVHLVRLAQVFVYIDACLEQAAELLAGVRAHHLVLSQSADESTDLLRARLGDNAYEAAARRGEGLTLQQLAEHALIAIDDLRPCPG